MAIVYDFLRHQKHAAKRNAAGKFPSKGNVESTISGFSSAIALQCYASACVIYRREGQKYSILGDYHIFSAENPISGPACYAFEPDEGGNHPALSWAEDLGKTFDKVHSVELEFEDKSFVGAFLFEEATDLVEKHISYDFICTMLKVCQRISRSEERMRHEG